MAASDARPVCRKGVAWRIYFALRTSVGALYTSWAAQDSEVSLDGASFADCTNEATEIGTSGCGYLDLTSSETNADCVVLKIATTGGLTAVMTIFPEEAGDYRADVTHFGGAAGTFSGGRPEVNASHWGGTAIASAVVNANAIQISGDSVAADNLETACDGGSFNLGGGGVVAASVAAGVTLAATTHTGAVIPTVTTLTNLPSIPADWLTATGIAASAVTELQSGLAMSSELQSVAGSLPASTADAVMEDVLSDHVTPGTAGYGLGVLVTTIGTTGAGLTAIPWNATWDAEVQSECTDAIVAAGLPRSGVTYRYTQVAANSGAKTADVSIGAAT